MVIDLMPLINRTKDLIEFNFKYIFDNDVLKNTSIVNIEEVIVNGDISKSGEVYDLNLNIVTNLTLQDSVSLDNIVYPVNLFVSKTIETNEESEEYYKIFENTLDIIPIVWENIVLEVPLRIVKEEKDTILSGDGWSLNKIETEKPLSDLKELLDMEERK